MAGRRVERRPFGEHLGGVQPEGTIREIGKMGEGFGGEPDGRHSKRTQDVEWGLGGGKMGPFYCKRQELSLREGGSAQTVKVRDFRKAYDFPIESAESLLAKIKRWV